VRTASDLAVPSQVEVVSDSDGKDIVWKSNLAGATSGSLTVDGANWVFRRNRAGKQALEENRIHWVRLRTGDQTEWSPWHMTFR
jgi:hypothetical protein